MHLTPEAFEQRFAFHSANTPIKQARHQLVRSTLLNAAEEILDVTGAPTREQSLAITKLEEAMFWANAAIAREPDVGDELEGFPGDSTTPQT